jgi:4a-hydroxytetrahydrobiopterin dehydratase
MPILDQATRTDFLAAHSGWTLDGETIAKTFVLSDFNAAMGFVTRVALLSEVADHHPDIDIRWNKVTIALTTHDQGGLTEKDVDLAGAIEAL